MVRDDAPRAEVPAATGGYCSACGAALTPAARFCGVCGASVPARATTGVVRREGEPETTSLPVPVVTAAYPAPQAVGQFSSDGRWWWNGVQWVIAAPPNAQVTPSPKKRKGHPWFQLIYGIALFGASLFVPSKLEDLRPPGNLAIWVFIFLLAMSCFCIVSALSTWLWRLSHPT
jgi:hypothetical protein